MKSKLFILGCVPVIIWSSVAALIHKAPDTVDSLHVAFIAIIVGALFSGAATISFDVKILHQSKEILSNKFFLVKSFLCGMFICFHYYAIYFIFSSDYVVQGNILNYLWPIFLFLFFSGFR